MNMKGKKSADIKPSHGLSAKQLIFCEQYLIDRNGKQAAIRTGYAANSAEVTASKLLRIPKVSAYIDSKTEKVFNKLEITFEKVMQEYARIAFFDPRNLYTVDGALKQIRELDDDDAAVLAGIEVQEEYVSDSDEREPIGSTKKVKFLDKIRALDSICKIKGWNAPQEVKHTGKVRIGYGKEED